MLIFILIFWLGLIIDMWGNYFLEDDFWSKNDSLEEEEVEGMDVEGN